MSIIMVLKMNGVVLLLNGIMNVCEIQQFIAQTVLLTNQLLPQLQHQPLFKVRPRYHLPHLQPSQHRRRLNSLHLLQLKYRLRRRQMHLLRLLLLRQNLQLLKQLQQFKQQSRPFKPQKSSCKAKERKD